MINAVVFDLGEVLSSPPSLLPTLAERIGSSPESLGEHYWKGRDGYDAGLPDEEYWGPLLTAVGFQGDDALIAELAALDAGTWAGLRPAAWQLLRDCREAGVSVSVLSNAPRAMHTAAEAAPWRQDIDHLFVSANLGAVKPDPEIYRRTAETLGVPAEQIAFVDDKQANVDGARAAGWQAHLWVDDDDTRAWLVDLGVLS